MLVCHTGWLPTLAPAHVVVHWTELCPGSECGAQVTLLAAVACIVPTCCSGVLWGRAGT